MDWRHDHQSHRRNRRDDRNRVDHWEVCHHLRGEAGDRQIEGAKVGLAHVIGLGSACGVHILEKSAL